MASRSLTEVFILMRNNAMQSRHIYSEQVSVLRQVLMVEILHTVVVRVSSRIVLQGDVITVAIFRTEGISVFSINLEVIPSALKMETCTTQISVFICTTIRCQNIIGYTLKNVLRAFSNTAYQVNSCIRSFKIRMPHHDEVLPLQAIYSIKLICIMS